ncbi:L-2-amino-thiazoline-4-carboxylic acid hydrolase domain protein [Leptospira inadai serovar Lyme str. 10]|uniref:L-2-amino-thiazoline-4-carboxylic acid hydrolase domain protein n=2 Tax=Leptospira inadai serovar Lyme TaxID=293084 RepID=V6HCH2_9LEPT|nr:L-2-amino-thiazoline-4-carboxylic acid hydrolase domain protein [Leptospira inadai serovar Lyme str. 10]
MNFWYELSMNLTYWNTLKNSSIFNREDIRKIKANYQALKRQNKERIVDIQSEYHLSWSSLIHATYNGCIEKGFSAERSIEITEDSLFKNMKPDNIAKYIVNALNKATDPFGYLVRVSKKQESNFFGSTFSFSRTIDDPNSYHLLVHNCFYNNYFRSHQVPELMKIACKWDLISWSKGIVPEKHGITFSRPTTLGLDDSDCQFNFERIPKK